MSSGRSVWRIAAVLAVAATTTVVLMTTTFSGCATVHVPPDPVDATKTSSVKVDAAVDSTTDGPLI